MAKPKLLQFVLLERQKDTWHAIFVLLPPGQGTGHIVPPVQTTTATTRHADQRQTGLDISSLEGDVQRYFENGLAPSTRRTYQAGINKFVVCIILVTHYQCHNHCYVHIYLTAFGHAYMPKLGTTSTPALVILNQNQRLQSRW